MVKKGRVSDREGLNGIRAVNAYNGRPLWDHSLPSVLKAYDGEHLVGTAATQSNLCLTGDGVYVRTGRAIGTHY